MGSRTVMCAGCSEGSTSKELDIFAGGAWLLRWLMRTIHMTAPNRSRECRSVPLSKGLGLQLTTSMTIRVRKPTKNMAVAGCVSLTS